ncbi:immunity 49 family protein [Pseudoalteromonas luteoviolacea]|uniref:Imm49 family immunity protein n=1 Tax=Pseudoalteromonas luteoviolacea TaxID=43657 RepID=UPI001B3A1902|nr:Imm49 family immunity protein [Pseudoalteromonas luteoviolacea]MBQ4880094.1 immunity 49 family protein [Pseudoalteromonas luteoviolacea]MBQ4909111.1 immunity 49 family protein [Pseudoalteromonas luteoviolacea]
MAHIKFYPRHYDDMEIYKKLFIMILTDKQKSIKSQLEQLQKLGPLTTIWELSKVAESIALHNYDHFRFFCNQEQLKEVIAHWRTVCDVYRHMIIAEKLPVGERKAFRIFDTELDLLEVPEDEKLTPATLCLMLEMAIIMRDKACVEILLDSIPDEYMEINGTDSTILGLTAHANFIHSAVYYNSEPVTLLEKCNALNKHISTDYWYELGMWQALDELRTTQDLTAFEAAVVAQFTRHSNMHKHDTGLITHMLPKQLIAPVCIAHDKYGYVPQHQNDYLPEWLLTGKFEQAIPSCDD